MKNKTVGLIAVLLASIMWANNETGVIFPVEKIAEEMKSWGIVFHTDAVQAVGKIPIDLKKTHIDMLSISGHKLHAPKGIGALFVRRGTPCRPLMIGGHQEGGRRAGTENVPYIVGLARALNLCMETREEDEARISSLRDRLEQTIAQQIPNVQVNGGAAPRLPGTSNIACHYIEGEGMLYQLSDHGVWSVGLDAAGERSLFDLELATEAVILVLGAEGHGLARLVRQRCDTIVSIPLAGRLDSLNVSAAAALACFEVARRRR